MNEYLEIIENDLFNIATRLKEIDKNYFLVRNKKLNRFEVHNSRNKGNTLCVVCPFEQADNRLVRLVNKTRVENSVELLEEIENNNKKIDRSVNAEIMDKAVQRAKEILIKAKFNKTS